MFKPFHLIGLDKLYRAKHSLEIAGLPIGLAHNMKLTRDIPINQSISWNDVSVDETLDMIQIRREMEQENAGFEQ